MSEKFRMIDPPDVQYSEPEKIEEWIAQLKVMEQTEEVKNHLKQANKWLEESKKYYTESGDK